MATWQPVMRTNVHSKTTCTACEPLTIVLYAEFSQFSRRKKAGHGVRPHWLALSLSGCALSSCRKNSALFSSFAFLLSFSCSLAAAASLSPVVLLQSPSCISLALSSSSPLPYVVLLSLLALSGHSLSFFCPFGVFMLFSFPRPFAFLSSSCPSVILLLSR